MSTPPPRSDADTGGLLIGRVAALLGTTPKPSAPATRAAAIGADMDPHDQPVVDDDEEFVMSAFAAALETLAPAQRIVLDAMWPG